MNETASAFKILVIEDDAAISRVLNLELQHEGYDVESARDGLEGLEKALKEPDLVILDLMLPRMDGLEVCRRIRAKSSVPIIMITSPNRSLPKNCSHAFARVCARRRPRTTSSSTATW
jgi:DNA-binding response OmpR family regulator